MADVDSDIYLFMTHNDNDDDDRSSRPTVENKNKPLSLNSTLSLVY